MRPSYLRAIIQGRALRFFGALRGQSRLDAVWAILYLGLGNRSKYRPIL